MTNPNYNRTQLIFSLNSIANAPSNHKGTVEELEAIAQKVITESLSNVEIQELIGEWELIWGPVVHQETNSDVADNAMYIARNKNNTTDIVVAISGTNPISKYGWVHEDLLINPMQNWPYKNLDPQPKIANGTKLGMDILLEMVDHVGQYTLPDFLKNLVEQNSEAISVTVTGHSLGGALTPAVALALHDLQGDANSWDPESSASIAVLPSAGPTSGNKHWADYYDSALGATTTRIWNAIDIVPHVWELDMVKEIPTLYEPIIEDSKFINVAIKLAEINSIAAGNMHQICDNVPGLPGKVIQLRQHKVSDLIAILEQLQSNKLIKKVSKHLLLEKKETKLLKKVIADLNKHYSNENDLDKIVSTNDILALELNSITKPKGNVKGFIKELLLFIFFMLEAVHQHIKAYPELLNTTEFASIVDKIKKNA